MRFYDKFFNRNWYRDIRMYDSPEIIGESYSSQNKLGRFEDISNIDVKKYQQLELQSCLNKVGSTATELTYFKRTKSFQNDINKNRYVNWIFFDFDTADPRLKEAKKLYDEQGSNPMTREKFREVIMTTDVLKKPFVEGRMMAKILKRKGIPTFATFSGASGLHLHMWFPEQRYEDFVDYKRTIKEFSYNMAIELYLNMCYGIYPQVQIQQFLSTNLSSVDNNRFLREFALMELCFDPAPVGDPLTRVCRVPYSRNPKTGLADVPFDWNETIEDIFQRAIMPKNHIDFDINDHISEALLFELAYYDAKPPEEPKQYISSNGSTTVSKGKGKVKMPTPMNDMRVLVRWLAPENFCQDHTGYHSYYCVFHSDNKNSAIVNQWRYKCYPCNINIGYFEFVKRFFDLDNDLQTKKMIKYLIEEYNKEG